MSTAKIATEISIEITNIQSDEVKETPCDRKTIKVYLEYLENAKSSSVTCQPLAF